MYGVRILVHASLKVVERKDDIDWKRNATFTTFGFVYLGGIQYSIYNTLFPKLVCNPAKHAFKTYGRQVAVAAQVFVDQAIQYVCDQPEQALLTRDRLALSALARND
eukprot:1185030-Prorocentrum_minimum.AAC.5